MPWFNDSSGEIYEKIVEKGENAHIDHVLSLQ